MERKDRIHAFPGARDEGHKDSSKIQTWLVESVS